MSTKQDHADYRAGVLAVAKPALVPEAEVEGQLAALDRAKLALGIGSGSDTFEADVRAAREAERLREVADTRELYELELRAANVQLDAFEESVKKQRAVLSDAKNRLLGLVQVADAAALKLAAIEKDNPRIYG